MLDEVRAFSAFVTMDPKGDQMKDAEEPKLACCRTQLCFGTEQGRKRAVRGRKQYIHRLCSQR
jgi:hypothetical protein